MPFLPCAMQYLLITGAFQALIALGILVAGSCAYHKRKLRQTETRNKNRVYRNQIHPILLINFEVPP